MLLGVKQDLALLEDEKKKAGSLRKREERSGKPSWGARGEGAQAVRGEPERGNEAGAGDRFSRCLR